MSLWAAEQRVNFLLQIQSLPQFLLNHAHFLRHNFQERKPSLYSPFQSSSESNIRICVHKNFHVQHLQDFWTVEGENALENDNISAIHCFLEIVINFVITFYIQIEDLG